VNHVNIVLDVAMRLVAREIFLLDFPVPLQRKHHEAVLPLRMLRAPFGSEMPQETAAQ